MTEAVPRRYRALFISDVHLGTRGCQAERLLDFLREHPSENLYLVGDIVDFWAMRRGVYWTAAQNTVVQKVLRRARHGARVVFVPGNHDEALREHADTSFGDIVLAQEYVHETADGRRYLLVHGDEFDQVTRYHRWAALLGDVSYNFLVRVNALVSRLRRLLRLSGYWSLAGYAKRKVKSAVSFIYGFEEAVIHAVRERGFDGVICGHIHAAASKRFDGIHYLNCGDWVDSCTAVVEWPDGRMDVVEWGAARGRRPAALPAGSALPEPAIGEEVVLASRRGWQPADPELSRR